MGAVDLVLQIESPKSVARGLQRIGRAGHGVDEVSRGRIFPKFRGDLLECAVVCRRMHEGLIESTVVPRNALDVLAQQIVAIAVAAEPAKAGASTPAGAGGQDGDPPGGGVSVDELHALVTSSYPYAELSRELLENVLDMLDGRYPSKEFGELRARIVWDRVAGTIRARSGSRQLAVANAGTIPDRGLYAVTLPDGRRVGELDEEMVYEARPGQAFLLGASTWRIEEIGRDRVIVTPAPGAPGAVPFWKGDSVGRAKELGEAVGAFARWAVEQDAETLAARLRPRRARRAQPARLPARAAGGHPRAAERPHARARALPRRDRRLAPVPALALRRPRARGLGPRPVGAHPRAFRPRGRRDLESDDGIVLHLPDLDADEAEALPSAAELVLLEPEEVEHGAHRRARRLGPVRCALSRERLARAADSARLPRTAHAPVAAAAEGAEPARGGQPLRRFPDRARDLQGVPVGRSRRPGPRSAAARPAHRARSRSWRSRRPRPRPFASSLLFDYVATYMYEGDTPNAERRAAALSLDRDLLRELLGQEELRELIDPGALERVEDDLQRRSELTRATGRDGLHDVLRHVGDLTREEVSRARARRASTPTRMLAELERERRAIRLRVGGEERYVAADEAGLYRDALSAAPPGGSAARRSSRTCPTRWRCSSRASHARTGRSRPRSLRSRYGVDASAVLRELERSGDLVRGELRPGGTEREWCDVEVLRRLRRASLAALRKEIEPTDRRSLAAFLPSWQGVDRHSAAGAGIDRLREVLVRAAGPRAARGDLGARRAAPAHRRLLAVLARQPLRERRARVGGRRPARGALRARRPVLPR